MPHSSANAERGAMGPRASLSSPMDERLAHQVRHLSAYLRNLPRAHDYLCCLARAMWGFRRPATLVSHYLRQTSPAGGVLEMRDGTRVRLSGHPHDVITLFVVFLRQDYGRFPGAG